MTVHDLRHIRAAVESWRRGSIDADSAMREVAATLDAEDARREREAWSAMMPDDAVTMPALMAVHGCCGEVEAEP